MGGWRREAAVPGGDRRPAADGGLHARRAGTCSRSSTTRRRRSRRCRSTRRSSTRAGWSGSRARRRRSRARLRREVRERGRAADHGRRRAHEVPGQGGQRRRPSPTGCSSCRPTASSTSCTRCRSRRCGASGRSTAARLRRVGIETVGAGRRARRGRAGRGCVGNGAGRKLHALAHNRDPRPVAIGRRRRSMGDAARARQPRPALAEALDSILVALVDRLTRRLRAAPSACAAPRRCGMRHLDFTRSTRSHTLTEATAGTMTILAALRELLGGRAAADRAPRAHAARDRADEPRRRRAPSSSRCRSSTRQASALDAALDDVRDRYGADAIKRAVLRRPRRRASQVPLLPRLRTEVDRNCLGPAPDPRPRGALDGRARPLHPRRPLLDRHRPARPGRPPPSSTAACSAGTSRTRCPPDAPGKYFQAPAETAASSPPSARRPGDAATAAVWNTYIWVESADDTAAKVREAGGRS